MLRSTSEKELNLTTNSLARATRPLDQAMMRMGAYVEDKRRAKGVYPRKEIYTPSLADSDQAYMEYMADAAVRRANNQLRPGEIVTKLLMGGLPFRGKQRSWPSMG